jgi:uncharacterized membrane protein YozB (DUF420 family)
LYVAAVVVDGLSALVLAPRSQGGMVAHLGFGTLGALWLATTLLAWRAIRARRQAVHRRWMLRSYALTLAAVTLRLYLPVAISAGVPFDDAYRVIAWACWMPNLVVLESMLRRGVIA